MSDILLSVMYITVSIAECLLQSFIHVETLPTIQRPSGAGIHWLKAQCQIIRYFFSRKQYTLQHSQWTTAFRQDPKCHFRGCLINLFLAYAYWITSKEGGPFNIGSHEHKFETDPKTHLIFFVWWRWTYLQNKKSYLSTSLHLYILIFLLCILKMTP